MEVFLGPCGLIVSSLGLPFCGPFSFFRFDAIKVSRRSPERAHGRVSHVL